LTVLEGVSLISTTFVVGHLRIDTSCQIDKNGIAWRNVYRIGKMYSFPIRHLMFSQ